MIYVSSVIDGFERNLSAEFAEKNAEGSRWISPAEQIQKAKRPAPEEEREYWKRNSENLNRQFMEDYKNGRLLSLGVHETDAIRSRVAEMKGE